MIQQLLEYEWAPVCFTCDYEKSFLNVVHLVLPKTRVVGCIFHFMQALYGKMAKAGVKNEYFPIRKANEIEKGIDRIKFEFSDHQYH